VENKTPNQVAIQFFVERLREYGLEGDIGIAVVPSSTKENRNTGIRRIGTELLTFDDPALPRHDLINSLIRTVTIEKASKGGPRGKRIHLETIEVDNESLVAGKRILLIDDITTTGGTLHACAELLLGAGASYVQRFALLKT
jgi:phosphoribosylpyrophosphate synthetase